MIALKARLVKSSSGGSKLNCSIRNWQSVSIEQFIQALDSYVRWYNKRRAKISLSSCSFLDYFETLGIAT